MANEFSSQGDQPFTLEADRRILDGFLGNKREMVRDLKRAGYTEKAILARGAALGLSPGWIAKHQTDKLAIYRCLGCEHTFVSQGPQNRLCNRCRQRH